MSTSDLPLDDRADFDDADRGLIGTLEPAVVTAADGHVVWDHDAYAFLAGECPATANPSLWRQGQLCARQGLYEVTEGIYQIRGLDLSNMTVVEGEDGVVVIDPLVTTETAAAALGLYRKHRGDRPVTALIYTHSHVDHFGGAAGVVGGDVPIVAPEGFLEHAVAENVYAGNAMARRATYMYGRSLETGPAGQIGCGLGLRVAEGTISLLPPTVDVTHTGQIETLDGVAIEFQLTPGTEAPAEMNFLFPDHRALCMAENATHNLHNLVTLRGALVRDPRVWARYLSEAITLFADRADVAFASHHWPTWGRENFVTFLSQQRDVYTYLHDQTLRLINAGYTGLEIAEMIELPPALERAWHARGYYGSVSHNVKAIYQRYMGWFDGRPSSLWAHPPQEAAMRYVECMGGVAALVDKARRYVDDGDLRFAAELLSHAVFAEPGDDAARELLARTYERLGFGAENGPWRNFYLTGASELRAGVRPLPVVAPGLELLSALTVAQVFDSLAIRVNGPKAWAEELAIVWNFTDSGERHEMRLSNGALIHYPTATPGPADLTLTLRTEQLVGALLGQGLDEIGHEGDLAVVGRLLALVEPFDPDFPIVAP